MSVSSELIGNTQNSFQTHAQRGANIVMRGGKKNRRTRKKRGGRVSPGSSFWRIFTETPASWQQERLTNVGYPKPKTKENINKLIDFCKKNVIFGRTESNFSVKLGPDFEITQNHVSCLAPYYIHSTGTDGDGWSCDVCGKDDFPNRGRGYGNNDWEPEFPANFMAVACGLHWAICIDCIDKIDTWDKGKSRNFSIVELKEKGLDVTKLEEEAKTNIENMITDLNEKKKADILLGYKTIEEKAANECDNIIDITQYKNEIEGLRTKIRKIKTLCKKNLTKKRTTLASESLEKMKTYKKQPLAPQTEGGRRKRRKSRRKRKRTRRRKRRR